MNGNTVFLAPSTFRSVRVPRYAEVRPDFFVPRSLLPSALLAPEADTSGWDAASAVRLPQVNEALKKQGVYPRTFKLDLSETWKLSGEFGQWQMTRGGSGSIVFLKTPITKSTMTFSGQQLDIKDGSVTIQVKLKYLPQPQDKPEPGKGDPNDLLTDSKNRSADDPAVVIQNIVWGSGGEPPFDLQALFRFAISQWYNQNLDLFNYVFAVVSLNQLSQSEQFQWLKPTYTSYAYYDGSSLDPNDEAAYFGVLTMTAGRDPDGLANQLPASAIPPGQGAALLIGQETFSANMLLPSVVAAFPKASRSDFKVTGGGKNIEISKPIPMEQIKVGAVWYTPVAEEFIAQIVGNEIQTRTKIHVPISPGIDAYITTESFNRLALVNKPDGSGQTLSWVESRPAKKDHYYKKEPWVDITTTIVALIGLVATAVAGAVLTGVLRIVVMVIIGIIIGIAAATPDIIGRVISDGAAAALPPIERMLTEFTDPIQWPETTGFKLADVQLNGSLQLIGSFV